MLKEADILSIIQSELSNADDTIDLDTPLDYYLGKPNGREVEGRSSVTSTDVADAIEWIMPQIMKSFTQTNEVVIFDPVREGDEKQAELESEYVYEVLMKQNDGFIIIHQFVKDALLQKNGLLKVYYAEKSYSKIIDFTEIDEDYLQQILANPEIDILEKSEYVDEAQTAAKFDALSEQLAILQSQAQQGQSNPQLEMQAQAIQLELQKPVLLYDVKLSITRKKGQIYVDSVPPEEFKVNRDHNSISLENARFTAHEVEKTISDIIQEYGLTFKEAKELPSGDSGNTSSRDDYNTKNDDSEDDSQRLVTVSECYMQIDIDEVGISKLMKITVAGGGTPTKILHQEEIDTMPWVSTTAFIMSHKFYGQSLYDRLKEIQDQKTTLWRNMFDNIYMQNNQRLGVIEKMANMDDLMLNRPGGIVRVKRPDAVFPIPTPALSSDSYSMMDMLDRVRAGRSGVDPEGGATPQNIGDRVGSQGVERMMNAKEELVGLIIRVIAETGIKPLCTMIRDLATKHINTVQDFNFRGEWHQVTPTEWCDRAKSTVRVGTGTGNQQEKTAALSALMEKQALLAQAGSMLVDEAVGFNALDDFAKFNGLNGATRYFVDPSSEKGLQALEQQRQQQGQMQQMQMQMQQQMAQAQNKLADAEQQKAQAQMGKAQADAQRDQIKNELTLQKQTYDSQINFLKQQLEEAKAIADNIKRDEELELRREEKDKDIALELTRIEAQSQSEQNANFTQNEVTTNE